jgi:hypothetical protein
MKKKKAGEAGNKMGNKQREREQKMNMRGNSIKKMKDSKDDLFIFGTFNDTSAV